MIFIAPYNWGEAKRALHLSCSAGNPPDVIRAVRTSCTDVVYGRISTCTWASPTLTVLLCKFEHPPDTREMQSINGASLRVGDSLIERIALNTFES